MGTLDQAVAGIPRFRDAAAALRERVLADVVCLGEMVAPTGAEGLRAAFVLDRWGEAGVENAVVDELNNVVGFLHGEAGNATMLVAVPMDTLDLDSEHRVVEVSVDRLIGPFVGDNCLALAALASLPALLDSLQIRLRSNLLLAGTSQSLGRGNLAGLRHVLSTSRWPISLGFCLESVQLGRLNYATVGVFRGAITCRLPTDYDWAQYGASGTILPMSDIIARLGRIPLSQRPLSTIVMGSIEGGVSFHNIARETVLRFEARSESSEELQRIRTAIANIVEESGAQTGKEVALDTVAWREPGRLDIAHPLVRNARAILSAIGVAPMMYPTTTQLAAVLEAGLPGVTLGLTRGERRGDLDEVEEEVAIPPLWDGMAQVVANLVAADGEASP